MLQEALDALDAAGFAAEIWDSSWRLFGLTAEYQVMVAAGREDPESGVGESFFSEETRRIRETWPAGPTTESIEGFVERWGGAMAAEADGGIDAILAVARPRYVEILQRQSVEPVPAAMDGTIDIRLGSLTLPNDVTIFPLREGDGSYAGAVTLVKPAVGAAVLGMLALGDRRLFERMLRLMLPGQRPGAIMFGDLEGSTALARRLSSARYFQFVRRFSRAADEQIVDAGGMVGKHVGDGITAFFLAEELGSDSAAAAACIAAARRIQEVTREVATRSDLDPDATTIRFGLHWGSSLYVGRLQTSGRMEVTALGDEVNEGARIEACASGGLLLASKPLVERLTPEDAGGLAIDAAAIDYTPLGELASATEKARRDAPSVSVCVV